jgi:sulfite exporter TauE/SafE
MPCGPLQVIQIYALVSGSMQTGATSLLVFCLGTVPLVFGLGALPSVLDRRFNLEHSLKANSYRIEFLPERTGLYVELLDGYDTQ